MSDLGQSPEGLLRERNGVAWLEVALGSARAVFSTRLGGCSPPPRESLNLALHLETDPSVAAENRQRLCRALGVALDEFVLCSQVHGTDVREVAPTEAGTSSRSADGLLRLGRTPPMAVQVADCAAVAIADPVSGAGAVVHAGWRGAAGGIVEKAAQTLAGRLHRGTDALCAAIGPCVRGASYQVGTDVWDAFGSWGAEREQFLVREGTDIALDLGRFAVHALASVGVPVDHVTDTAACTISRPDLFFSHRRDGPATGRMWGALI